MNARTKLLNPTRLIRSIVRERDSWDGACCCVVCGCAETVYNHLDVAHVIARSQGGMAVEENLVMLCRKDHDLFDHGGPGDRETMRRIIREYLDWKYPDRDESLLTYRKEY